MASPLSLPFSIPLPFIFQEANESIDEEDPRPTSSKGAYITSYDEFHAEMERLSPCQGYALIDVTLRNGDLFHML